MKSNYTSHDLENMINSINHIQMYFKYKKDSSTDDIEQALCNDKILNLNEISDKLKSDKLDLIKFEAESNKNNYQNKINTLREEAKTKLKNGDKEGAKMLLSKIKKIEENLNSIDNNIKFINNCNTKK